MTNAPGTQVSGQLSEELRREFALLIGRTYRLGADLAQHVEEAFTLGEEQPLTTDEAMKLLTTIIDVLRTSAAERNDQKLVSALQGDIQGLVDRLVVARARTAHNSKGREFRKVLLDSFNGASTGPVRPTPYFHGKEIPMMSGYVRTKEITLWDRNERLDIHLNQFRHKFGREPNADELLDIMLSKLNLPGVEPGDAFEIVELARSIANNGVRKPPILDTDGTLLDGNRRVTACHYILNSNEFTLEQKKRAEHIFIWQLTEFATDDDRYRVVVSLNFEPDCKQNWPEYVKARKVAEAWRSMVSVEIPPPGPKRQAAMKRDLSQRFALGPNTTEVNRYLRMVQWADDFEDYQIDISKRDQYEVKHKANEKFQYFDELSKGASPGTVAYTLNQDEALKRLAFDLLFQGKFRNWTQIRDLRYVANNDESRDILRKAKDLEVKDESDREDAQELVDQAIAIVRSKRAEERSLGSNTRIETFVKWLEELPVKAFRDEIKPENLQRLLRALQLVQKYAEAQ